ncbi:hypothetical protein [Ruminococcus sp.]|uniref:hypothetical protein n=1 Tax=Ruminococcus sp. TaxID=41978 RepID=UPI0025EC827B|nr:hypothetical protein [Ruminococcus sp.]MBR1432228.1 hypothetical protein [Ruminococcus sp.]
MDYKTMAEIVKSRGERILEERRIRRKRIIRITSGAAAICAAAVTGFGIWHSNTAKFPSSINFNRDTAVTTTYDTIYTTTSASENNNTVTSMTVTHASKDVKSTVTSAEAVKNAGKASQVTATTVKRAAQNVPAPTAVTAAPQESNIDAPTVTVPGTTEIITSTHRRIYYMNKLSAGFAAMLVGAAAVPKPVSAVNDTGMRPVPFEVMSSAYDINDFEFDNWRKDESIIDIDQNGKFDVHDIYVLYLRSIEEETHEPDDKYVDVNKDNSFDELDVYSLISYYTCYNKVEREILDPIYYTTDINELKYAESFVKYFTEKTEEFHGLYDIFIEAMEEKSPDLDIDGSGKTDFGDIMDIYFFDHLFNDPDVTYDYMNRDYLSFDDKLLVYNELTKRKFPSEHEEKCMELYRTFDGDRIVTPILSEYLIRYYLETSPVLAEYSDHRYYEALWENKYTSEYLLPNYSSILSSFINDVESTEREMGLPTSDVRSSVDMTNIENEYKIYKEKVKNGLLPEPDVDLDGDIDFDDHKACDDIFNCYMYYESDIYSDEVRYHLMNDFDINGNGISGDAADCSIAQIYICEKTGIKTKQEKAYEEFRDAWINGEVSNYPWSGTNCLDGTRYPLTDPDDLFTLCYNYWFAFTYPTWQARQAVCDKFYEDVTAGIKPEPDVDMNGIIDENDYIFADNTLYSQTHTSENLDVVPVEILDNYITNFDLNGNGISGDAMDTTILLDYTSRKCDIDSSELERMADKAHGHYHTTYETSTGTTVYPSPISTNTTTAVGDLSEKVGDANCDTDLDLSDAILVMQALANPDKYEVKGYSRNHITEQGKINADVDKSTRGLTSNDALCIQQYLLRNKQALV